jgi:translation initiation factor IF-3
LITAPKVRLIGSDGSQLGIVSRNEALRHAQEANLDLVEIASSAEPPVCLLTDYGKYNYELMKKKAAAKKQQVKVLLKGVQFRPNTDEADYQVKLRNILRFLEEGHKAKITLRYVGREMAHQELGMALLLRLQGDLKDSALIELAPKMEGKQLIMVVAPSKVAKKKA